MRLAFSRSISSVNILLLILFYPKNQVKSIAMQNRKSYGNFLFQYDHLRKHGSLNYETPFDKLQKVTELLS